MLAAIMVPRERFRHKKVAIVTKKRAMLLIKRSVWNVENNKKKGSWEQATVGLMLFRCDYAETEIIIIYYCYYYYYYYYY